MLSEIAMLTGVLSLVSALSVFTAARPKDQMAIIEGRKYMFICGGPGSWESGT